jgi:hypothetical protein
MSRFSVTIGAVAAAALVLAGTAQPSVRRGTFTPVVHAGDYASLSVAVSPRARCTITIVYDTTVSHAHGLGPKTGSTITWEWRVGSSTHPGRWPITVDCGKSGQLKLKLRVLPA